MQDFEYMSQLFASLGLVVGIVFATHIFVLAFANDKVQRPTLYKWSVILFSGSIILPIALMIYSFLASTWGANRYEPGMAATIGVIAGLLPPVLFVSSMVTALFAVLPPRRFPQAKPTRDWMDED